MPLISVIVPVYKVEPYLHRCVDSILAQSFQDFELILVDDGSPDNCGTICDEYAKQDNRVRVIHQQNGGLSAARNAGIDWAFANSGSEWLTFIDSDDWVNPEYLQLLFDAAERTCTNISICSMQYIEGSNMPSSPEEEDNINTITPEEFWCSGYGPATVACGKMYRKELFIDVRYPVGKLHEDAFTTYKLLYKQKKVSVISAKLYYVYRNPNSITRSAWNPKRLDDFEALTEQAFFFNASGYSRALMATIKIYYSKVLQLEKYLPSIPKGKLYLKKLHKMNKRFVYRYRHELLANWGGEILEHAFPLYCRIYHLGGTVLRALNLKK